METEVFVILVNFNGHKDTIECLESLLKSSYGKAKFIIVDNSDNLNSLKAMQRWAVNVNNFPISCRKNYPIVRAVTLIDDNLDFDGSENVIFIRSRSNNGFAAGNNIGVKFLRANSIRYSYLWFLNNDTVVAQDTLSQLVLFAGSASNKVGIIGAKLLFYDRPTHIQGLGGRYRPWTGQVYEIGYGQKDVGQFDQIVLTADYIIGASMFVKRSFIEQVGLMNEDYFVYFEELDWSIRGQRLGWTLGFCLNAKVYHKVGSSINTKLKRSLLSDYYSLRNRILITKRYFPYALLSLYAALLIFFFNRIRRLEFSKIKYLAMAVIKTERHLKHYQRKL